eukprot:s334_g4.t1
MAALDVMDGVLDMSAVELATVSLEPYVLTWHLGPVEDGEAECAVLVLLKREEGILLALPGAFLPEDLISAGNRGDDGAVFGPSFRCVVPSVIVDGGVVSPTGVSVDVLVIDCLPSVLQHLRRPHVSEEIAYCYDDDSPFSVPSLDALMPEVREWLAGIPALAEFYTPEEVDAPYEPESPLPARRPQTRKGTPTGSGPKPKRATTAALAAEVQTLSEYLPRISQQLDQLAQRQNLVESRMQPFPSASTLVSRPLGKALEFQQQSTLGSLAKAVGAPPRTSMTTSPGLLASINEDVRPAELAALESEKQGPLGLSSQTGDSSLAQAVLEQSRALTSLAAQIAAQHGDPLTELAGPSTGTRGAAGHAKLQAELAMHRGTFFASVLQQMSRRMSPTASAEVTPAALMARGVSGLRYLERFGGYGRQRELGLIQFQVMTAFDYLMEDNVAAAKDTVALLAVGLEQCCLDNGRMDLASLLCLQEDPPSSIFQNRVLSATSRARSFAPLADQRWVTSALAFLKELEVITSKRAELTGGGKPSSDSLSETPKAKPKAQPKRKGKGKGQPLAEDAETTQ